MTEQWVAKKLEVLVDVPEELDLEWLRGSGPQSDEQLQPEEQPTSTQTAGPDALAAAAGQLPHVSHASFCSYLLLYCLCPIKFQCIRRDSDASEPKLLWVVHSSQSAAAGCGDKGGTCLHVLQHQSLAKLYALCVSLVLSTFRYKSIAVAARTACVLRPAKLCHLSCSWAQPSAAPACEPLAWLGAVPGYACWQSLSD